MIYILSILVVVVLLLIMLTVVIDERNHRRRMNHLVKLKTYWDGINRRCVIRHNVTLEVNYRIHERSKPTRTKDISTRGIGLVLQEKFERWTPMDLEIGIRGVREPIKAKARVMWCKEAFDDEKKNEKRLFHTGLKFVRFQDPRHEKKLFDYIGSIEHEKQDKGPGSRDKYTEISGAVFAA